MLTAAAARILKAGLPPLVVDEPDLRPADDLAASGELASLGNAGMRGSAASRSSSNRFCPLAPRSRMHAPADTEARLLFDYLRGDLRSAAAELEVLDRETTDFDQRLSILSLRAMIRWAQGDPKKPASSSPISSRTREQQSSASRTRPRAGHQQDRDPAQAWAAFLSVRACSRKP